MFSLSYTILPCSSGYPPDNSQCAVDSTKIINASHVVSESKWCSLSPEAKKKKQREGKEGKKHLSNWKSAYFSVGFIQALVQMHLQFLISHKSKELNRKIGIWLELKT